MALLGEIVVEPSDPQLGQSVLVEALAPDGSSYAGVVDAPVIRIAGITGARQYVQFARSGPRQLVVVAEKGGEVERRIVDLTVAPRPGPDDLEGDGRPALRDVHRMVADLPLLQVGKTVQGPYQLSFSLGGFASFPRGLAMARPILTKTLEPELTTDQAPLVVENGPARSSPARPEGLPLRPVTIGANKVHVLPETVKLLAGREHVIGAIEVRGGARGVVLVPPEWRVDVPVYHWDFGDGTTATTAGPRVDHDYEPALDPELEHQSFDVTLRTQLPDGSVQEVRRTLSVFNAYAMCKRRGAIVPRVEQQTFATTDGFGFRAVMRVHNVEPAPLTLSGQRVRVMSEDTDAADVITPLVPVGPFTVPAKGSVEIPVSAPFSQVPKNSMGFTVYLFGNGSDGLAIRIEAHFDILARDRVSNALTVGDIAIGKLPMVQQIIPATDGGPVELTPESVRSRLTDTLLLVRPVAGLETIGKLNSSQLNERVLGTRPRLREASVMSSLMLRSLAIELPPQEGAECDPDNLPELSQAQLDEGWVCQATPETREVVTPSRYLNALKGDIILSPGGSGLIGGLLMQVTPPQRYSHSGIMTRNYNQVTHSTASDAWLLDHPNGSVFGTPAPTEGLVPNALKYLWPGSITQSVDQSILGEKMTAPDNGVTYSVKGFTPTPEGADVGGHWEIIPPLVVKPDPLLETPEIRAKLRQVASDALSQTGNSHYRFFCYTDPSLGQRAEGVAPASAGWASGTYPSVCSSFIWMALKRQGAHLESANATASPADLESLDVAAGAQVGTATTDGLYLYTGQERQTAGEWLRGALADLVARTLEEKSGILSGAIDFFSDMTDDVANQVINTFASDWADTESKDSDAWRSSGDANAVSPDNILLWDSPQLVGLYGYAAPLAFRPARLEEVVVSRWRKVPTMGTLSGRVWFNGAPVSGALVQLFDGATDFTDANGRYEIPRVPFGPYTVKARKDNIVPGLTASTTIHLDMSAASQTLDITLQPPTDAYRRVQVQAHIQTTDDEWWPWNDEEASTTHFREVSVSPWHTHEEIYFEQRMGGEIRIELRLFIDLSMDRSVNVNVNAKMFEGMSEDTTDLNDEENTTGFRVLKDQSRSGTIRLYNEEFAGGDISNIDFTITNLVQP